MALHIASERADRLARELAAVTGERLTTAVEKALEERLTRLRPPPESVAARQARIEEARRIMERAQAESRAYGVQPITKEELEEMLGFDEY